MAGGRGDLVGEALDELGHTDAALDLAATRIDADRVGGDVVITDTLSSYKSPRPAQTLCEIGAWFLFLPPYSPDLNTIEMAFAKLKTLIRRAAVRTYDDLWRAAGQVCDLFTEQECYNFFRAAGYETD